MIFYGKLHILCLESFSITEKPLCLSKTTKKKATLNRLDGIRQ